VAGETQFSFENPASSLPLVEAGQVRALASTSDRRSSQMPNVPTMIEAGVADFTSVSFTGVVAPAGTPAAIVNRLNAAINASLQSPEVASALVRLGVDAKIFSPEEFAAFLARERDKWAAVIKAAGRAGAMTPNPVTTARQRRLVATAEASSACRRSGRGFRA
jgi:tripartite-type tricarboxylate transporter receptor subunit TctC